MDYREILLNLERELLAPVPDLTTSEWADEYRKLSIESSAEAGRWKTDRAPYLRGIMDACSDPRNHEIIVMSASQVGKSETHLNIIGRHMHIDPCPILLVMPTETDAKGFSKERLAPMIRDTKELSEIVNPDSSRDSANTILAKSFRGGYIVLVGSNSPSHLASRPIRLVLADEIDRYGISNTEGDPVDLAIQRTANYHNRLIVLISSPTDEKTSRIYNRYQHSTRAHYYAQCVHCLEDFEPIWDNVKWGKKDSGAHDPKSAMLHCPQCGAAHDDAERNKAVINGKWIEERPGHPVKGFHVSAICSPWVRLEQLVRQWLASQQDFEKLKVFMNTRLGLPWKDVTQGVDDHDFTAHQSDYDENTIPKGVMLLTMAIDVQNDRLEYEVMGSGRHRETWSIEYGQIIGSPALPSTWEELEQFFGKEYLRDDGLVMEIKLYGIDSGGSATSEVYDFTRKHARKGVRALKGAAGNRPIAPRTPSKTNKGGAVWIIGVDQAKEAVYTRMQISTKGPGYCHFPATYETSYFDMLTAERFVIKKKQGVPYKAWHLPKGKRNEALDVRAYNLALVEMLTPNYDRIEAMQTKAMRVQPERQESDIIKEIKDIANSTDRVEKVKKQISRQRKPRQSGGWMGGLKL